MSSMYVDLFYNTTRDVIAVTTVCSCILLFNRRQEAVDSLSEQIQLLRRYQLELSRLTKLDYRRTRNTS